MKLFRLFRYRGLIEVSAGRQKPSFRWVEGWSESTDKGDVCFPWMTAKQCREDCGQNTRAVFVRPGPSTKVVVGRDLHLLVSDVRIEVKLRGSILIGYFGQLGCFVERPQLGSTGAQTIERLFDRVPIDRSAWTDWKSAMSEHFGLDVQDCFRPKGS